jgi:hypothetical protein
VGVHEPCAFEAHERGIDGLKRHAEEHTQALAAGRLGALGFVEHQMKQAESEGVLHTRSVSNILNTNPEVG